MRFPTLRPNAMIKKAHQEQPQERRVGKCRSGAHCRQPPACCMARLGSHRRSIRAPQHDLELRSPVPCRCSARADSLARSRALDVCHTARTAAPLHRSRHGAGAGGDHLAAGAQRGPRPAGRQRQGGARAGRLRDEWGAGQRRAGAQGFLRLPPLQPPLSHTASARLPPCRASPATPPCRHTCCNSRCGLPGGLTTQTRRGCEM